MFNESIPPELATVTVYYIPSSEPRSLRRNFNLGPFHSAINPIPPEAILQEQISSPFLYKLLEYYVILATPTYRNPPPKDYTSLEANKLMDEFADRHGLILTRVIKPAYSFWESNIEHPRESCGRIEEYLSLLPPEARDEEERISETAVLVCFRLVSEIDRMYRLWWCFTGKAVIHQATQAEITSQIQARRWNPIFQFRSYFHLEVEPLKIPYIRPIKKIFDGRCRLTCHFSLYPTNTEPPEEEVNRNIFPEPTSILSNKFLVRTASEKCIEWLRMLDE